MVDLMATRAVEDRPKGRETGDVQVKSNGYHLVQYDWIPQAGLGIPVEDVWLLLISEC